MFAFISGYFFKESNCENLKTVFSYTVSKIRKLFLPYLGWVVFYNLLSGALYRSGFWRISGLSLQDLIYGVVTSGVTSAFTSPAWFAPLLFGVSVVFCVVRWLFRKAWNDHWALILFVSAGTFAVAAAGSKWNVPIFYMFLKVPFFLQFYYIGLPSANTGKSVLIN